MSGGFEAGGQASIFTFGQFAINHQAQAFVEAEVADVGRRVLLVIASTKTLAKLANHAAKTWQNHTGGVVDLRDQVKRDWVLKKCSVSDVWGVGRKMTLHLEGIGIKTAWDLAHADAWTLRKQFSVVVEKTARELAGTTCLELDV